VASIGYTEDELIEQPAIELLKELGWEHINALHEILGPSGTIGRDNQSEIILQSRLRIAIKRLNPDLPPEAYNLVFEELTRDRSRLSMPAANREIYQLLRNGIKVHIPDPEGEGERVETVRLIDWDNPANNDFFLVSQFWVVGEMYKRRADLVGFVNGIPLLFVELKAAHRQIQTAYTGNLTDYKDTIPQLFWFNAFIILSNGSEAKVGSITSDWGHFNDWKKINSEGEEGVISLETVLRGTCEPIRFLDILENFLLFMGVRGGIVKIVPKNHQYLGVNNVIKVLITTLTPTLSQREREKLLTLAFSKEERKVNYRGGYEFSGLVDKAREFRKKSTSAEEFFWELLRDRNFLGLKFRRQHQIGDYIVDFYCDEFRLVVELDGPVHDHAGQFQKDKRRTNYLKGLGFSLVRLRNQEVLDNPEAALGVIADAIGPSPLGRGMKGEGAETRGRLGVFWHTQGSGKSISMIFFSQKVLRKIPGNWTFVVVTDRQELDDQIYKTFANAGIITEGHCQAESSKDLRRLLTEDHRFFFTLIHKFRTEDGSPHPVLSQRDDIIVITDEAHRSQYDTLALNMRNALPNASFLAFTGTPLIIGEEKTREVFGEYVSIYNFKQSVDDGATVPLYYENRIPELQLKDERAFKEGMDRLLEEAELDEDQEKKLDREFSREYHLITRNDRLEKIAEDIVEHFTERGQPGKGMVVSIDKATAVKMYNKVQKYWKRKIDRLIKQLDKLLGVEREEVEKKIAYMRETDMAVVVSSSQNEVAEMKKKGVDIIPHRQRMVKEDLDTKFKDPDDLFRLVFVCAMWMTGFDVPSCSAIYLDKPMRNHTLMQTIARANRVFKDKVNGLIVDYVGVFRNLQRALAIYGSGSGGGVKPGEEPVKEKAELVAMLKTGIDQTVQFLKETGVEARSIIAAKGFERVKLLDEAVDAILINDATKKRFINLSNTVNRIFKAILPDPEANEFVPVCALFRAIQLKIEALQPDADISKVMEKVEDLLDESITAKGYIIREPVIPYGKKKLIDLSKIDFKALKKEFAKERKRMEIEKLRAAINSALEKMVRLNKTRVDYLEKFQRMIDEYNQGAVNLEEFFERLLNFAKELQEEEKRGIAEGLSEEELAVFDLITKPEMKLTKKEEGQVKKVARELLETLKREKLVLDWRKTQATRAAVRVTVEDKLDQLPEVFTRDIYTQKCNTVYQHIFESYYGEGRSVYAAAA
jgi:type I restriction enzyme R subunit